MDWLTCPSRMVVFSALSTARRTVTAMVSKFSVLARMRTVA